MYITFSHIPYSNVLHTHTHTCTHARRHTRTHTHTHTLRVSAPLFCECSHSRKRKMNIERVPFCTPYFGDEDSVHSVTDHWQNYVDIYLPIYIQPRYIFTGLCLLFVYGSLCIYVYSINLYSSFWGWEVNHEKLSHSPKSTTLIQRLWNFYHELGQKFTAHKNPPPHYIYLLHQVYSILS